MKTRNELANDYHNRLPEGPFQKSFVHGAFVDGYDAGYQAANLQWISVKERLPEEGIRCLVYTEWERIILSERIGARWLMKEDDGQYERPAYWVTHWMPLPNPPEEK